MRKCNKYCLCFFVLIVTVKFSYTQQRTYTIYYEQCNDCNTNNQSYTGNQVAFETDDIVSDFGRRRGSNSKWHMGVDFSIGSPVKQWDHFHFYKKSYS